MNVKQVLIMRTRYSDGKGGTMSPRKGKLVAQGAHGACQFMMDLLSELLVAKNPFEITAEQKEWLFNNEHKKVTLQVGTEEELLEIYNAANSAGLTVRLITDHGHTEFHGKPTHTCVAIGPHEESKIDAITGHLKLL